MAEVNSFLLLSNFPVCVSVCVPHLYSSINRHLGCFHILAIINNAAKNIGVHISFLISVFAFFG